MFTFFSAIVKNEQGRYIDEGRPKNRLLRLLSKIVKNGQGPVPLSPSLPHGLHLAAYNRPHSGPLAVYKSLYIFKEELYKFRSFQVIMASKKGILGPIEGQLCKELYAKMLTLGPRCATLGPR